MKQFTHLLGVLVIVAFFAAGCDSATAPVEEQSQNPVTQLNTAGQTVVASVISSTFPSTNDINRDNGWAHVNEVSVGIGEVTLDFINPRSFFSCFEYRTDGDTSQATGDPNFNPAVPDLYPFLCLNNDSEIRTFEANEYIEIRSAFGAESDERFDWTQFDVLADAQTKEDCQNGGWENYGFSNQGQCIRFVNTGKDSR